MAVERPLQILALTLLVALAWILWPLLSVVLVGGYVVLIAAAPFERLARAVGGRRRLAAAIATSAVALLLFVPLGWLFYLAVEQAAQALPRLDGLLRGGGLPDLAASLPASVRGLIPDLSRSLADLALAAATRLSQLAPRLLSSMGWLVAEIFLTLVTIYYLFEQGPAFVATARRLVPLGAAQTEALFVEFQRVALGIFWGTAVTVAYQGAAASLGYWIFGVRQVLLLGVVTAIAAFIPFVGTALVWLPVSAVVWLTGHPYRAVGLAAYCLFVVSSGDNVLRPLVSRGQMALPRLLLFLTLFGGLELLGAKGILLGPLIGSLAVVALRLLEKPASG